MENHGTTHGKTWNKTRDTGHGTRDTGHGTRDTGHGTPAGHQRDTWGTSAGARRGQEQEQEDTEPPQALFPRMTHTASHARDVTHDTDTNAEHDFPVTGGLKEDSFPKPPI